MGLARDLRGGKVGFLWRDPVAQSHQNKHRYKPSKELYSPFLVGKGPGDRSMAVGMCGVIRAIP